MGVVNVKRREVQPIPDTNKAAAYAAAFAAQTNNFAQSLEEAVNAPPQQLTVKFTLPNGSFITGTYACRVERCTDDPTQFPDFSPSPPTCGEEPKSIPLTATFVHFSNVGVPFPAVATPTAVLSARSP